MAQGGKDLSLRMRPGWAQRQWWSREQHLAAAPPPTGISCHPQPRAPTSLRQWDKLPHGPPGPLVLSLIRPGPCLCGHHPTVSFTPGAPGAWSTFPSSSGPLPLFPPPGTGPNLLSPIHSSLSLGHEFPWEDLLTTDHIHPGTSLCHLLGPQQANSEMSCGRPTSLAEGSTPLPPTVC